MSVLSVTLQAVFSRSHSHASPHSHPRAMCLLEKLGFTLWCRMFYILDLSLSWYWVCPPTSPTPAVSFVVRFRNSIRYCPRWLCPVR